MRYKLSRNRISSIDGNCTPECSPVDNPEPLQLFVVETTNQGPQHILLLASLQFLFVITITSNDQFVTIVSYCG